jgi:hypothetical protein
LGLKSNLSKKSPESFNERVENPVTTPIFYFPGSKPGAVCQETLEFIRKKYQTVETYTNPSEFFTAHHPPKLAANLFMISLETQEDVLETTELLDELWKREWHWQSEIIIISAIDQPETCAILIQKKCIVISKRLSTPRTLTVRIESQIAMQQMLQLNSNFDPIIELAHRLKPSMPFIVDWKQPNILDEEIWFIPTERFIHKENHQWTLVLLGPNPSAGKWVASESKEDTWQWIPQKSTPSEFTKKIGEWYFQGKKPIYHNNRWKLSGPTPHLYFINKNHKIFTKIIGLSDKKIAVSPNSPQLIHQLQHVVHSQNVLRRTQNPDESESSPPNLNFRLIDNSLLFWEFLNIAMETKTTFILWQKNSKMRLTGTLSMIPPDGSKIILELSEESQDFIKRRGDFAGDENYSGNFNTDQGCMFFGSRNFIIDSQKKTITLYPDQAFFYVQRRGHTRIKPTQHHPIKISTHGLHPEILNLSPDGISLKFKISDYESFNKISKKEITLEILEKKIQCELKLEWTKNSESSSSEFIYTGFQFLGTSDIDYQTIQLFIFQEILDHELN